MVRWFAMAVLLALGLIVGTPWAVSAEPAGGEGIRSSILQGTWYPADAASLRRVIQGCLSTAKVPSWEGGVQALVVPHAGYRYSGPVAAYAYRMLRGQGVERVVLIGPSHQWAFRGVSVSDHDAYETPLGRVPVDREAARRLRETHEAIGFVPQAHAREHSLEIQIPFLQCVLDEFTIVPVIMGRQDRRTCMLLASGLERILQDGVQTLLVASTDLSHYHSTRSARTLDETFIGFVRDQDPDGLLQSLSAGRCEACGGGPTAAVMHAVSARKNGEWRILRYATSGDVTGELDRVVGYLAAAFVSGE
jgi:MEMO1 family protein